MMVLRLIRLAVKPGQMPALRDIYNGQIIPAIRATPGHHSSHPMEGVTDPTQAIGWIVWNELKFADAYIERGAFASQVALIRHLLTTEPQIEAYRPF